MTNASSRPSPSTPGTGILIGTSAPPGRKAADPLYAWLRIPWSSLGYSLGDTIGASRLAERRPSLFGARE